MPFASAKHARIAKQVIEVDRELQPQVVKRTMDVQDDLLVTSVRSRVTCGWRADILCRTFRTATVRLARLAVNAYLENVELVARTIGEFGEDAERVPS